VSDALDLAGGPAADSDPNALNLAARVRDGQRIEVPVRGRPPAAQADARAPMGGQPAARLNLNRADAAQLDTLPGVGAATSRRIIEYREKVGQFERVEQLLDARLVNRGVFDQIKDLVTVE
jgi:competence protein ComEA